MYKRKAEKGNVGKHRKKEVKGINIVFFQAEDGIRERSPSRGLGDVNKRQAPHAISVRGRKFSPVCAPCMTTGKRCPISPSTNCACTLRMIQIIRSTRTDSGTVRVESAIQSLVGPAPGQYPHHGHETPAPPHGGGPGTGLVHPGLQRFNRPARHHLDCGAGVLHG